MPTQQLLDGSHEQPKSPTKTAERIALESFLGAVMESGNLNGARIKQAMRDILAEADAKQSGGDIPLNDFLNRLTARTANVIRAAFDGTDEPWTLRLLTSTRRNQTWRWHGCGEKTRNEIDAELKRLGFWWAL